MKGMITLHVHMPHDCWAIARELRLTLVQQMACSVPAHIGNMLILVHVVHADGHGGLCCILMLVFVSCIGLMNGEGEFGCLVAS